MGNISFEGYDRKHRDNLLLYLKHIESKIKYAYFMLSLDSIEILTIYKKVFLVYEDGIVINIGYEIPEKKHFRFLFEMPKYDYEFLKDALSVAVVFINKNSVGVQDYLLERDTIVDNESFLRLEGSDFKKIRKKINRFKKRCLNVKFEEFDPRVHRREEMEGFLKEWGRDYTRKGKFAYLNVDRHYFNYVYDKGGKIEGIVARDVVEDKIIGFAFFLRSSSGRQGIGLAKKALYRYNGLNEMMVYERSRVLFERYKIRYMNMGSSRDKGILEFKSKFKCHESDVYVLILKRNDSEKDYFWEEDHYMD